MLIPENMSKALHTMKHKGTLLQLFQATNKLIVHLRNQYPPGLEQGNFKETYLLAMAFIKIQVSPPAVILMVIQLRHDNYSSNWQEELISFNGILNKTLFQR